MKTRRAVDAYVGDALHDDAVTAATSRRQRSSAAAAAAAPPLLLAVTQKFSNPTSLRSCLSCTPYLAGLASMDCASW